MSHDTEDRIGLLMHRATDTISPDSGTIAAAMRAGDRRRRTRRLACGGAVLASAAVLGTTLAAILPDTTDQTVAVDARDSEAPSYGAATGPTELRVPTPDELSTLLADALPGDSTEVSTGRVGDGVRAERAFQGASVEAFAYAFASDGRDLDELEQMRELCRPEYESRFTGCVTADGGWAQWMKGRPDVAGASVGVMDVRVIFYRDDAFVIDLSASNAPDVRGAPVSKQPVLSRDELVELAGTHDWFPAAS